MPACTPVCNHVLVSLVQSTLPQPMGHGTAAIARAAGTMNFALRRRTVRKRT